MGKLLLEKNGVRVPMRVFGHGTKHLKRNDAAIESITSLDSLQRLLLPEGRTVFEFDDAAHREATGAKACSHEWWHAFNENKKNEQLRAHAHMKMREVAYFLQRLDGSDSVEANGKTLLENSLITISSRCLKGSGAYTDESAKTG